MHKASAIRIKDTDPSRWSSWAPTPSPPTRRCFAGTTRRATKRFSFFVSFGAEARADPNRKRNKTHETLFARVRRCAPPRTRWTDHKAQRDSAFKIPLRSEFNTYGGFTSVDNTIVAPSGKVALVSFGAEARGDPNRKRNETHVTLFARVRRCAPPRARWTGFIHRGR